MNNDLNQIQADIIDKTKQLEILKNRKPWWKYILGGCAWGIPGTVILYVLGMLTLPFMGYITGAFGFKILVGQAIAIGVGRYFWKTRKERKILRTTDDSTITEEIKQLRDIEHEILHGFPRRQTYNNPAPTVTNVQSTTRQVGPTTRPQRNYNYGQPSNQNQTTNNQPTQPQNPYSFQFNPNQVRRNGSQPTQTPPTKIKTR